MKKPVVYILSLVAVMLALTACSRAAHVNVELPPIPEHGGIGVRVISATEWFEYHPDVVASYLRNYDNYRKYCYLELFPYMRTLYEGFGFAVMYNSPRGHVFSMESTDLTERPALRANCFACKSANYPAVREAMGIEFYSTPFEELRAVMTQPVSCFNCHGNEPGEPRPMARYVYDALGIHFNEVSMASLSCAQCHVEYHFDQNTWEIILPYRSLADMYPANMLAWFNNQGREHTVDGEPFADFVNPRSGVRQIKVQHPEFETVYGRGSVHNSLAPVGMAFSCADCHMPTEVNAQGVPYRSHEWMSPLNNMQLIQGTCFSCHSDLETEVRSIQARYMVETHGLGNALADLMERLVLAVEADTDEAILDEIRENFRSAQFMWDFVAMENSNGAHNSRLLFRTLEYGWDYANQVESMLNRIGH